MKTIFKSILFVLSIALLGFILIDRYHIDFVLLQFGQKDTMKDSAAYIEQVHKALMEDQDELVLYFKGDKEQVNTFASDAVDKALDMDKKETSSDFDYLRLKYSGMNVLIKGVANYFTITYQFHYLESKQETDEVSQMVESVLDHMKLEEKTEYEKVKAIHDYIIEHASYDINSEKITAYDNLVGGESICQGYAALTYKMMTEAGIDCRVILGKGKGVSHAWNIVRIKNKWYNIDCTWDDPVSESGKDYLLYECFLKSDKDFTDHVRDQNYNNEQFNKEYPMAGKSYKMK